MEVMYEKEDNFEENLENCISCPLFWLYFNDPVIASDGHCYEKDAIDKLYLESDLNIQKSPLTKDKLKKKIIEIPLMNEIVKEYMNINNSSKDILYEKSWNYIDNLDSIKKCINNKEFKTLMKYKNFKLFDTTIYSKNFGCELGYRCTDLEVFKYVINNSIDKENIKNYNDNMHLILHYVCANNYHSNMSIIKYLIEEKGIDHDIRTGSDSDLYCNYSPFYYCCRQLDIEHLNYFLQKGIDLKETFNFNDDTMPLINFIFKKNNNEIISYLLDKNITPILMENENPILKYSKEFNPKMLKFYISKDYDINFVEQETGMTPLHYVCKLCNLEMIKIMIDKVADVSVVDKKNMKPLFMLINNTNINTDLSLFLIEKFMEGQEEFVEIWNTEINGYYLIQNIILNVRENIVLQSVINAGIDLNKSTSICDKPIHIIFKCYNNPEYIELLLQDNSVDINEKINGWTPFNLCCKYNNESMIEYALTKGCDTSSILKEFRGEEVNYSAINLIEMNDELSGDQKDDLISILISIIYR